MGLALGEDGEVFDCPNGILRTSDGSLYVVNFNGDHMVRIAPDGTVSSFAELLRPYFDPTPRTSRVRRIRLRDRPWGYEE